jgi:hypothetical protein
MIALWLKGTDKGKKTRAGVKDKKTMEMLPSLPECVFSLSIFLS